MYNAIIPIILILLHITTAPTLAHEPGQPSYFKINDQYTQFYPIQKLARPNDNFYLPDDQTSQTFSPNQDIHFQLDLNRLQTIFSPETLNQTTFKWDLGDHTYAQGTDHTHAYSQPGTYLLTIQSDMSAIDSSIPLQTFQSIYINVTPDGQPLPPLTIHVNDQSLTSSNIDPATNVIHVDFTQPIHLQANLPSGHTAQTYYWDLGDGSNSTQDSLTHQYPSIPPGTVQLALRIQTTQGHLFDQAIGLQHQPLPQKHSTLPYTYIIAAILIVILIALYLKAKKQTSNHSTSQV